MVSAHRDQITKEAKRMIQQSQNKKSFRRVENSTTYSHLNNDRNAMEILQLMQNNRNRRFFGVSIQASKKMQEKLDESEEMMHYLQTAIEKRKEKQDMKLKPMYH